MALFILRYISSLSIFALGLRAPGIADSTEPDYSAFDNEQSTRSRFYQGVSHSLK